MNFKEEKVLNKSGECVCVLCDKIQYFYVHLIAILNEIKIEK